MTLSSCKHRRSAKELLSKVWDRVCIFLAKLIRRIKLEKLFLEKKYRLYDFSEPVKPNGHLLDYSGDGLRKIICLIFIDKMPSKGPFYKRYQVHFLIGLIISAQITNA